MKQVRKPSAGRTNIVLDAKLVERVKRLAKVKTTRDAVHVALEHYVRSRDYSEVLALRGTGGVSEGYDPKAASPHAVTRRARRLFCVDRVPARRQSDGSRTARQSSRPWRVYLACAADPAGSTAGSGYPDRFNRWDRALGELPMVITPDAREAARSAAYLYARCRWAGVPPRSANCCLIATHAIFAGMPRLHHERDFNLIAGVEPKLVLVAAST